MFRNLRTSIVILFALSPLRYLTDGEENTGAGAALARETTATAGELEPFRLWLNRNLKAGRFTVNYDSQSLVAGELLADGKLRLLNGDSPIDVAFDAPIIEQLMPQII